jgi:hypothetical protein
LVSDSTAGGGEIGNLFLHCRYMYLYIIVNAIYWLITVDLQRDEMEDIESSRLIVQ